MRVAIVGSRTYTKLTEVYSYIKCLPPDTIIVSGGARGVDTAAEHAARQFRLAVQVFLPDWTTHGKKAGFIRNAQIVNNSDKLVAFWDGESKGTLHSILLAQQKGIPVVIYDKKGNCHVTHR